MKYEFEDWEIWNGGKTPCSPDTQVQVQRRKESRLAAEKNTVWKGEDLTWPHRGDGDDIIAFRRVKEPEKVTLYAYRNKYDNNFYFTYFDNGTDTHKITFDCYDEKLTNPIIEYMDRGLSDG